MHIICVHPRPSASAQGTIATWRGRHCRRRGGALLATNASATSKPRSRIAYCASRYLRVSYAIRNTICVYLTQYAIRFGSLPMTNPSPAYGLAARQPLALLVLVVAIAARLGVAPCVLPRAL